MAELEAKVSENVIEACTRTSSVRKCVFTSSLLACTWQNNTYNNLDYSVINEESWSDEQLCIDNKVRFVTYHSVHTSSKIQKLYMTIIN